MALRNTRILLIEAKKTVSDNIVNILTHHQKSKKFV